MPRANRWSDLTIGIIAFIGIAAVALGVLFFARVGALHGHKTTLYLVTDDASGLIRGTEVWLGGRQVGTVSDVSFRPASTDTAERVLIQMDVLSRYLDQIRRNSAVRIRPGASLIGEPVVAITVGTPAAPNVHENDTLHALAQLEGQREQSTTTMTALGDSLVAVAATITSLRKEVHETGTDVDRLRARSEARVREVGRAIDRFTQRATRSRGTVSLALHDTALHMAVARVRAQTDSLHRLLTGTQSSIGRFQRDSTLLASMRDVRSSVATLQTRVAALANGGALAQRDSALSTQLQQVHVQLDMLIADVKHHPFKYLHL
jgi:ABC-type transporter Mla subunit MlaD